MNTFREINASIKTAFKNRAGFVPAKAYYVGSFPAIRFEGDLPVSLVTDIGKHAEKEFPWFTRMHERQGQMIVGFISGGTVINWA